MSQIQAPGELRQKQKPFRSRKYLNFVKSLPCVCCGQPADDPHHIIGVGEGIMGSTAPDSYAMPVCRGCHGRLHSHVAAWEQLNGLQWMHVAKTLALYLETHGL